MKQKETYLDFGKLFGEVLFQAAKDTARSYQTLYAPSSGSKSRGEKVNPAKGANYKKKGGSC